MGREIRMVPPNWEHPRKDCEHSPWAGGCNEAKRHGGKCYQPMYDNDFATVMREWIAEWDKWERGEFPSYCEEESKKLPFWEYHGAPPRPDYYRPAWKTGEATWYQVYQTVSEGSPVTPPFATKAELIDYLATHGDFWDQSRGDGAWSRENAEKFVESEWAPSMVMSVSDDAYELKMPRDGA